MSPPPPARRPSTDQTGPSLLPSALSRHGSSSKSMKPATARSSPSQSALPARLSPASASEKHAAASATEVDAEEAAPEHFEPFFTLVEDTQSSTAHHPAVHYIFSDDDGDVLNDALLRISSVQRQGEEKAAGSSSTPSSKERCVVVDLGEDGRTVTSAQSLTGDWQVLASEVSTAPMLEGGEGETGGLMLRVQGTEGIKEKAGNQGEADVEIAIERFRERMEELRRVVEGAPQSSA